VDVIGELEAHPFHDPVAIEASILGEAVKGSPTQQENQGEQKTRRLH
jgi:hypothetical protein